MTKLCTFYATKIQINDHEIDLNHDTEKNWEIWKICYLMMYILSAQFQLEIEVPQLGSARLGSSWKIPAQTHH